MSYCDCGKGNCPKCSPQITHSRNRAGSPTRDLQEVLLKVKLPKDFTIGDLKQVTGTLFDEAAASVDWEDLYNGREGAIAKPGIILLAIADALRRINYA